MSEKIHFLGEEIPLSVSWNIFGRNKRRCVNCDEYKKKMNYKDFVCKHFRGFCEAPSYVKRCFVCETWKKKNKVEGDFWCKHNDYKKKMWNDSAGWKGAKDRAKLIRDIL